MPFDDTSLRSVVIDPPVKPATNTLSAIGLWPVPDAIVEDHKDKVVAEFVAHAERGDPGLRQWQVDNRVVHWQEVMTNIKNLARRPLFSSETQGAPPEIINLAKSVQREIKGATFTMEYFYTDPILRVCYTDSEGREHRECLGIWDHGKVVALATGTIKAHWFASLFGRFWR